MRTVVYITKNKIWVGEQEYVWNGQNMGEIWEKIKRETRIGEMRVVLGNDVSFVTSMKMTEEIYNRESILRLAKSWMPFPVDNECFDWKEVELAPGEKWLQFIAMERSFLEELSSAVLKNGLKVELVTAIGVIMAEKTAGREAPVVVKFVGKENLTVLAVNGLADLVTSDISDDDLMVYAKQKWGLAVNPEVLTLNEAELKLTEVILGEKTKGEDNLVLNIPILKEVVVKRENKIVEKNDQTKDKVEIESGEIEIKAEKTEVVGKKPTRLGIYLIVLMVVIVGCGIALYMTGSYKQFLPGEKTPIATPTVSLSPTATPTEEPIDYGEYSAQVLNGSGVTGEAAKIKTQLVDMGMTKVEAGNTEATSESEIWTKTTVPIGLTNKIINSVEDYSLVRVDKLTDDEKYDLMIVLGGTEKP